MVFSSDKYFTVHPEPGTVLTVDLRGRSLELRWWGVPKR